MSVIDIIKTGHEYLIGETHDNGVFGQRATAPTLSGAWAEALYLQRRYKLVIQPVSDLVVQELVDAGMMEANS